MSQLANHPRRLVNVWPNAKNNKLMFVTSPWVSPYLYPPLSLTIRASDCGVERSTDDAGSWLYTDIRHTAPRIKGDSHEGVSSERRI